MPFLKSFVLSFGTEITFDTMCVFNSAFHGARGEKGSLLVN